MRDALSCWLVSLFFLAGCSPKPVETPKPVEISGQIFVVTAGRANIKMGLVDVHAVADEDFKKLAASLTETIRKGVAEDSQAAVDEAARLALIREIEIKAVAAPVSALPELEALRDEVLGRELPQRPGKMSFELAASMLGVFLPAASAKSDADGRFNLALNGKVWLVARANRTLGKDKEESYLWILPWERPASVSGAPLLLSNDCNVDELDELYATLARANGGETSLQAERQQSAEPNWVASLQLAREKVQTLVAEAIAKDKQKAEQEAIAAQVKLAQEALAAKEAMHKRAAQSAQTLARIPAGSFSMGDSFGEGASTERPVRQVTVSAFYFGKTEVTKQQWDEVKDWAAGHGYTDMSAGEGKAANHPVTGVNWWDAVKWCNARSELEGLVPCYAVGGSPMRVGTKVPEVNWLAKGYRLPTEAEWERAARGGLSGKRFPWGDTISHSQANYYSISSYAYDASPTRGNHPSYGGGTSPVGSFTANAYGLQDMAGNVWEWCWDWYGTYASGAQSDPRGEASGSARVLRSGGWSGNARDCRAADRYGYDPGGQGRYLGFRVLRSSVP
ncbi:MAG: SUMF1/EgtB/PvdO family nonheme iron enzyme [Verrucomicrobiota bacterium]